MSTRVLVIARHYSPSPGAASNRLGALVRALVSSGCEVQVITRRLPGVPDAEKGEHGEAVYRVRGDAATGITWRRAADLVLFPIRVARLARSITRPDVLVADPPPTIGLVLTYLRRRLRVPAAYYYADSWSALVANASVWRRALAVPLRWMERRVLRGVDLVVAVDDGLDRDARKYNARVALIPNGVDGDVFRPSGDGPALPLGSGVRPYFLYAGNYGEAHDAVVFARAAAELWRQGAEAEFDLVFLGYGSQHDQIARVASSFPDRLFLEPPRPPSEAAAALRGCIAALVSVRDDPRLDEAIPVKALAAVMSGAPVLYSGGGTFADTVQRAGLGVVARHDVGDTARVIADLARSPWGDDARRELAGRVATTYDGRRSAARAAAAVLDLSRAD